MLVNLISSKQMIGRFLKEFNIDESSYIDDFPMWIEDAVTSIGIPGYFVAKKKIVDVVDNRTSLPCNIDHLYGVFITHNLVEGDINKFNYRRLTIRNSPMIGLVIKGMACGSNYANIDGGYLNTSFEKGKVMFVYKGIPLDCDGFPFVPKDAKFNQALQYYFIYRMSLSGYKHPVVTYQEAFQMWERLYPRAANSINWMDLQEYQEFTEMWNNPLIGDLQQNDYIH